MQGEKIYEIIRQVIVFLIGLFIGLLVNFHQPKEEVYIKTTDTITVYEPVIEEKTITTYVTSIDTFYINKTDTVYLKDLPIEHKIYKDTLSFKDSIIAYPQIKYSGYLAKIDEFSLDIQSQQKVVIQKPKKIGIDVTIGPYIGYGINIPPYQNPTINHGIEVGIGIVIGPSFRIK